MCLHCDDDSHAGVLGGVCVTAPYALPCSLNSLWVSVTVGVLNMDIDYVQIQFNMFNVFLTTHYHADITCRHAYIYFVEVTIRFEWCALYQIWNITSVESGIILCT